MTSYELLDLLSDSIRKHDLQNAIRNMLDDNVWISVISPAKKNGKIAKNFFELKR